MEASGISITYAKQSLTLLFSNVVKNEIRPDENA